MAKRPRSRGSSAEAIDLEHRLEYIIRVYRLEKLREVVFAYEHSVHKNSTVDSNCEL